MGILHNFRKEKPPKDENSLEFRVYMAKKLNGRNVRYVLEREETQNRVIGKDGFLSFHEDEFSVHCGQKTVFRAKVANFAAWEFMNLEGANITGYDLITGRERTVMAYYKYHIK